MTYELFRGLAYRQIVHQGMHWYTTTVPLIVASIIFSLFLLMPAQPLLLTKDGIFALSLSVLSTLPGFYFAGLAAVATFNGLNMDAVMIAPAPSINVRVGGVKSKVDLSRRQFLSYLFAYLVILSFALCAGSIVLLAATPQLYSVHNSLILHGHGSIWTWLRGGFVAVYILIAASMIVTSLHGIFFLTERIHQP